MYAYVQSFNSPVGGAQAMLWGEIKRAEIGHRAQHLMNLSSFHISYEVPRAILILGLNDLPVTE